MTHEVVQIWSKLQTSKLVGNEKRKQTIFFTLLNIQFLLFLSYIFPLV